VEEKKVFIYEKNIKGDTPFDKKKIEYEKINKYGETPYIYALRISGDGALIKIFKKGKLNNINESAYKNINTIENLIKYEEDYLTKYINGDPQNKMPFQIYCKHVNDEVMTKKLIDKFGASADNDSLDHALDGRNFLTLKIILSKMKEMFERIDQSKVMEMCNKGVYDKILKIAIGIIEKIETPKTPKTPILVVEKPKEPKEQKELEKKTQNGNSLLHCLILNLYDESIEELLKNSQSIELIKTPNKQGAYPFHIAVENYISNANIKKIISMSKDIINKKDINGKGLMDYALRRIYNKDIISYTIGKIKIDDETENYIKDFYPELFVKEKVVVGEAVEKLKEKETEIINLKNEMKKKEKKYLKDLDEMTKEYIEYTNKAKKEKEGFKEKIEKERKEKILILKSQIKNLKEKIKKKEKEKKEKEEEKEKEKKSKNECLKISKGMAKEFDEIKAKGEKSEEIIKKLQEKIIKKEEEEKKKKEEMTRKEEEKKKEEEEKKKKEEEERRTLEEEKKKLEEEKRKIEKEKKE
jgi:hypothetical protein